MFPFVFQLPVSALAIRDCTFRGRSFSAAHRLSHRLLLISGAALFVICWSIHNSGFCRFFSSFFALLSSLVLCELFLHHDHIKYATQRHLVGRSVWS
ncbi:hypothetical protein BDW72DRAFT_27616 [Aspergillus terricola var. indicus]